VKVWIEEKNAGSTESGEFPISGFLMYPANKQQKNELKKYLFFFKLNSGSG